MIGLKVKNKAVFAAVLIPNATTIPTAAAMTGLGNGAIKASVQGGTISLAFVVNGTAYSIQAPAAGSPATIETLA